MPLWVCAVFSYASLYRTRGGGNADLFIAASVFLAPMAVTSLVSVVFKVHLMRRRIHQRRAAATARAARATFTPAARQAALRMLMERFVLRHDQLDFEERKSAHDAQRYQCYGYLLGIVSEVRTVFRDAAGLFSAHVR